MFRIKMAVWVLCFGFSLVFSMQAQAQSTPADSGKATAKHRVVPQDEVNAITSKLIAPCCWSETADLHKSPAARKVQQFVLRELQTGSTPEKIKAALVAQYGERILATPKLEGFNYFIFILPVAALLFGGLIVWGYLNRSQTGPVKRSTKKSKPSENRYSSQIENELDNFEN